VALRGKKVGRPVSGNRPKQRFQVVLDPAIAERLRRQGGGNLSLGIDKAARQIGINANRRSSTPEQLRQEEANALDRERRAFERRQRALIAVHGQFLPSGNGLPSVESMAEQEAAEHEWRLARENVERIIQEIKAGLR
jgi:hypothetical protein